MERGREGGRKRRKVGDPQHEEQQDGREHVVRSVTGRRIMRPERGEG